MQRLILGSTVYTVVEDFRKYNPTDIIPHEYYRIAKCKVKAVPSGSFKEYKLEEVDHHPKRLYFKPRTEIQETYQQAIEAAEEETRKQERSNQIMGVEPRILYREWIAIMIDYNKAYAINVNNPAECFRIDTDKSKPIYLQKNGQLKFTGEAIRYYRISDKPSEEYVQAHPNEEDEPEQLTLF